MDNPNEYNLSPTQLKWAQWWLTNKRLLKRLLIIFLIAVNLGIYFFAIYNFIIFLTYSKDYNKMMEEMTTSQENYSLLRAIRQPKPLEIVSTHVLYSGKDEPGFSRYDIGVIIKNNNPNWIISSLEYNFLLSNGSNTATQKTILLPNQEKYLFSLGQKISDQTKINSAEFNIKNIQWQRVKSNHKKMLDVLPQLIIKDQKINYLSGPDDTLIPQLEFTTENQSVFNFWQIDYTAAFYRGRDIVAVYPVSIKNLASEENRIVKIFLESNFPETTEIVFSLNTDILDPNIIYFKK